MKTLIILAHPETKSFNSALFDTAIDALKKNGHEVRTSDLYSGNFQPVSDERNFTRLKNETFFKQQYEELHAVEQNTFSIDVLSEQEKVEWCDIMIWQFPLYWFSVPAILKGWVDKVFAMGKFYDNGRIFDNGFSVGKKAILSITTGGPKKNYIAEKYGDMNSILFPIHHGILEFLGFTVLDPHVIYSVERLTFDERKAALNVWSEKLIAQLVELEQCARNP